MKDLLAKMLGKITDLNHRDSEKGATAVEYALIVGLIAIVIIVAVAFLGDTIFGNLLRCWFRNFIESLNSSL